MPEEKITYDRLNFQSRGTSVSDKIRVIVCPTTGGQLELRLSGLETIQGLKWMIARKLKIAPEKITLLNKDRTLKNGTLHDNHIGDSSRITLLPNMESGMTFQRTDASVIQALENLSESQINDFLTGRAPLLLAMRVGDHMMFVQLQLSTSQCQGRRARQTIKSMTTQPPSSGHNIFPPTSSLSPASLAEASRNLSQKLHELSRVQKDAERNKTCEPMKSTSCSSPQNPTSLSAPLTPPCSRPTSPQTSSTTPTPPVHPTTTPSNLAASGAVINSMNHIGKGVFSGTFSGTLDPTLQDQNGKPKKDVNTIVHILNDLLGVNAYQLVHPYIQIRAPPVRKPEQKPSSPVMKETPVFKSSDDLVLKEKVQHLQQMMQERKLKRKARREMKGPYQWNTEQIVSTPLSTFNTVNIKTAESTTCGSAESNPMEITESVENPAYLNSNIEHESLAV